MKFTKNFKLSIRQLLDQKLRLFLAALGIAIGIAAVMAFMGVGNAAKLAIQKKLEAYGTNVMVVNPVLKKVNVGRKNQTSEQTSLRLYDAERLLTRINDVIKVAPHIESGARVKANDMVSMAVFDGSTNEFFELKNYRIRYGRKFSERELMSASRVVILGDQISDILFGNINPIGKQITIKRVPYEVIGTLHPKGVSLEGSNEDEHVVIPIKTMARRVLNKNNLTNIFVQVSNSEDMESSEIAIEKELRSAHKLDRYNRPNDFNIGSQMKAVKAEREAMTSFNQLTISIAGLALFVGGIGVLAIMMLSVSERYPEIGVRMALGATMKDVFVQFLTEAGIIALFGGFLGIVLGWVSIYIVNRFTEWTAIVSLDIIYLATLFSVIIGIVFGSVPALKAAKRDPIDCLNSAL